MILNYVGAAVSFNCRTIANSGRWCLTTKHTIGRVIIDVGLKLVRDSINLLNLLDINSISVDKIILGRTITGPEGTEIVIENTYHNAYYYPQQEFILPENSPDQSTPTRNRKKAK